MKRNVLSWLTLVGALALVQPAAACERYFMIVFGAQRPVLSRPNYTHSFALFLKTDGDPGCPESMSLESVSISWLPKTLKVETYRLRPECGVNLSLPATLRWTHDLELRVTMFGPFQIRKELYDRAVRQVAHLQSGAVRYKAVDTGFPTDEVSNCIHAVADLADEAPRLRIGTPGWGDAASYFITLQLSPWILDAEKTHDWLLEPVGLAHCALVRRSLERNPTRGLLLRAAQSLRHLRVGR